MTAFIILFGLTLAMYASFVLFFYLIGRREDARAWGGLIPDCIVLIKQATGSSARYPPLSRLGLNLLKLGPR
jgi:hypothetical protein